MASFVAANRSFNLARSGGGQRVTNRIFLLLVLFSLCFASALQAQEPADESLETPGSSLTDEAVVSGYELGPRDRISITVFNHPDLSGEYELDGDGRFSMPLIGLVDAAGKTPVELEVLLVNRYKPDYLVNPRISIEIRNYRPYYLIGEVQSTGSFPYVAGITYLTAIAMAGGYTYRGKKGVVYVIRANDPDQVELKLDVNEKVRPGDIIRVAERLF